MREGRAINEYPEEWETRGRRDPLARRDRESIAPWSCDLCGAVLLTVEVGPHYRARHPDNAPRVTTR